MTVCTSTIKTEPIKIVTDERLIFLQQMPNAFLEINTSSSQYKSCVKCLTVDTSEALHLTLIGLVDMVKMLLVNKKFAYVLLGEFQSDRLEGEFGIMQQMSGGNYISYEQILSSVKLRRSKLFTQLEVPYNNTHEDDICCETELNDDEVDFMDNCFEMVDTISLNTKSTLYYISGYVAMKEGIGLDEPNSINSNIFTTNVSRGLFKHPSDDLLDLSFYLYAYYDAVETKDCINR